MNTPPRSFLAPPPSPPTQTKAALRLGLRGLRRQLKLDNPDAGMQAAQAFARSGYVAPATVAIYNAQGSELDAWPLGTVLRAGGAVIALPTAVMRDAPLVFRRADEGDLLTGDAAGVLAPGERSPTLRPDLVFVPLLAFDRFGGRLGQGSGYYDRTLAVLRESGRPVIALGLAYAGQEIDRAPMDAHDARLDGVLTEAGLTLFTDGG